MCDDRRIPDEMVIYRRLAAMAEMGEQGVLATVIRTGLSTPRSQGSKMIIHEDGSITGSVGGGQVEARVIREARLVLGDGLCRRLELDQGGEGCGGQLEVFLEPVLDSVPFVVVGGGHVGQAVIGLGRQLGLRFLLVDDRSEFLAPWAEEPGVRVLQAGPDDLVKVLAVHPQGGLLLANRSHDLEGAYLEAVLRAEQAAGEEFGFLGVVGSRSKAAGLRRRIQGALPGMAARLARLQMPVGMEIGGETPAEIALSVLAEAVAVLRGVSYLKDEQGRDLGIRLHRRKAGKHAEGR